MNLSCIHDWDSLRFLKETRFRNIRRMMSQIRDLGRIV